MSRKQGNQLTYEVQRYFGPLVFGVCLILSFSLFWYLLYPSAKYAYGSMVREAEKFQFARQLKNNINAADSLSQMQNSALKSMKLIQAVPSNSRASYILNTLMEGSSKYKLKISDINALNEIVVGNRIEIPFELSLGGSFHDLQRYLIDLENMDMVIKVRGLVVNSETINKPDVHAQLELSIYVQK